MNQRTARDVKSDIESKADSHCIWSCLICKVGMQLQPELEPSCGAQSFPSDLIAACVFYYDEAVNFEKGDVADSEKRFRKFGILNRNSEYFSHLFEAVGQLHCV